MVKKRFRIVCGRRFKPIPGSPALYGEVGKDLSKSKNRYSDMQLDGLKEKLKKRGKC